MREYLGEYAAAPYRGPLDEVDPEPPILLAALRERMVDLAGSQTAGAFPYLVTPERVRWMRARLDAAAGGARPALAVTLPVVLETDASAARAIARAYLASYLLTPNYHARWTEQGFVEADREKPGSDRLVDAMVAWGEVQDLVARVAEMHDAGADHVALIPVTPEGRSEQLSTIETLARPLGVAPRTR